MHTIVFTADIVKMYRQIKIHEDDQNLQSILWRKSPDEDIKVYKLLIASYVTSAAPFLATRTLQQAGEDFKKLFPLAGSITDKDFYVDDVLSGSVTETYVKKMITELIEILNQVGFQLGKWSSNSTSILQHVSKTKLSRPSTVSFLSDEIVTALGLHWIPSTDQFCFKVNHDKN